jgi:hypothetical protein
LKVTWQGVQSYPYERELFLTKCQTHLLLHHKKIEVTRLAMTACWIHQLPTMDL